MAEYLRQRFAVNNGMDVTADCRVLAEYSTQKRDGSKPRWNEYRVWECFDGSWIAEKTRKSVGSGEVDMTDVLVIQTVQAQPAEDITAEPNTIDYHHQHGRTAMRFMTGTHDDRRFLVMDFFEWHTEAKAFASAAGWDMRLRITQADD